MNHQGLQVIMEEVDFSRPLALDGITFSVQRLEWALPGGAARALIRADGTLPRLWGLAERLRCPVTVYDETVSPAWWGYLAAVQVQDGRLRVDASLERLGNRLAVRYLRSPAGGSGGGETVQTAWADDPASQARFGVREQLLHLAEATDSAAAAYRDQSLERSKAVTASASLAGEPVERPCALLTCLGWWDTLSWRHYAQAAGQEGHLFEGAGVQALGAAAANTRLAQGWQADAAGFWEVEEAWVKVRKVGSPTDAFKLDVCADSGGAPGSVLSSASLPASSLPADYRWVGFSLGTRLAPAAGSAYWLVASRTGSLDAANHYRLQVDESLGYSRGVLRLWNGSAWSARSPDADLNFALRGSSQTTDQIAQMAAATAGGQFLAGVWIETPSALRASPYRSGEASAGEEIEALLRLGTAAGIELLAEITPQRILHVFAKPSASAADLLLLPSGRLTHPDGSPLALSERVVGRWARLAAPALASGTLASASPLFIDRWTVAEF